MRCVCCNNNLNDFESTRRTEEGDFADMCNKCSKGLGITLVGRTDLDAEAEAPDGEDYEDLLDLEEDGYEE